VASASASLPPLPMSDPPIHPYMLIGSILGEGVPPKKIRVGGGPFLMHNFQKKFVGGRGGGFLILRSGGVKVSQGVGCQHPTNTLCTCLGDPH
jgi:hypothetical protein